MDLEFDEVSNNLQFLASLQRTYAANIFANFQEFFSHGGPEQCPEFVQVGDGKHICQSSGLLLVHVGSTST